MPTKEMQFCSVSTLLQLIVVRNLNAELPYLRESSNMVDSSKLKVKAEAVTRLRMHVGPTHMTLLFKYS